MQHIGVHADGKLAHIAGACVHIQHLVDPVGVVGGRLHDLAVFKGQAHVFKGKALIQGRCIIGNRAVDGILHRRRVHLAVRDIQVACAGDGRDTLDGEGQVCARAHQTNLVGALHESCQRFHGLCHLAVIQGAHIEIEVLKCLGAGVAQLCHSRVGIAQHHPAGLGHPNIVVHRGGI